MRVGIVGSGLLGTSLGLALASEEIWVSDLDARAEALAADLIGATRGMGPADLIVVATPVASISEVISNVIQRNLAPTVTDLASVKVKPQVEVSGKLGASAASGYVPGHPMAGREISGPEAARADLFEGRPWILTPSPETDSNSVGLVESVVKKVGGVPVLMGTHEHDQAMAVLSHLPQTVASALAGLLDSDSSLSLAGQGLRDVTRIAASDPELWSQILAANSEALAPLIDALVGRLRQVELAIKNKDLKSIYEFIEQGRIGRSHLPGKHGGKSTKYATIPVVIDDRPGQLGALFNAAAEFGINVEDVAMEHSPGQATGLVELSVAPESADGFVDFLLVKQWRVHSIKR